MKRLMNGDAVVVSISQSPRTILSSKVKELENAIGTETLLKA